ncbi:hypothetical protein AAC03nite_26880 [Alicyclobacillus acidoterrestris]|nr:hypothetical protein AAC03nite_26880 [Alicyclobacillus acidoterrestris]
MGIDPWLMCKFAYKMMHPVYSRRARAILKSYNYAALQDPYAVGCMIDRLCTACRDKLTPAQRAAAIRFVISQRCNPANPRHRARMRRMVFGY